MKVLVTGSRDWTDEGALQFALGEAGVFAVDPKRLSFIEGGAPGVDKLTKKIVERRGYTCHEEPAEWTKHGNAAGPIRNQKMIDMKPDICLALPTSGSTGTWDCVNRAKAAGIQVGIWDVAKGAWSWEER